MELEARPCVQVGPTWGNIPHTIWIPMLHPAWLAHEMFPPHFILRMTVKKAKNHKIFFGLARVQVPRG